MTALEWLVVVASGVLAISYLCFRFGFISRLSNLNKKKGCSSCKCGPEN